MLQILIATLSRWTSGKSYSLVILGPNINIADQRRLRARGQLLFCCLGRRHDPSCPRQAQDLPSYEPIYLWR